MDHEDHDEKLAELASIIDAAEEGDAPWKEVWASIKSIGEAFRVVRYPTKQAKDEAWARYRAMVDAVVEQRDRANERSEEIVSEIQLHLDRVCTSKSSMFGAIVDGVVDGLAGVDEEQSLNEWRDELLEASDEMRAAQELYSTSKGEIVGKHRHDIGPAIHRTKESLDYEWETYRKARRDLWRERLDERIAKKREYLGHLWERLETRRAHMDRLEGMHADAKSDEFESKVEEWMDEERERIEEIESRITEVEGEIGELESERDTIE